MIGGRHSAERSSRRRVPHLVPGRLRSRSDRKRWRQMAAGDTTVDTGGATLPWQAPRGGGSLKGKAREGCSTILREHSRNANEALIRQSISLWKTRPRTKRLEKRASEGDVRTDDSAGGTPQMLENGAKTLFVPMKAGRTKDGLGTRTIDRANHRCRGQEPARQPLCDRSLPPEGRG
jgi:hypothetical protein